MKQPEIEQTPLAFSSKLYDCYNGVMMGYFMAGASAKYIKTKYSFARLRVEEVLTETGVQFEMPKRWKNFESDNFKFISDLLIKLHTSGNRLTNYYWLGIFMYSHLVTASSKASNEDDLESLQEMLNSLNVSKQMINDSVSELIEANKKITLKKDTVLSGDVLNTTALNFLNKLIKNLPFEEQNCFVSMPFKSPYTDHCINFYKPAVEEYKYTLIRAWGGFQGEEYQNLMFSIIEKCGLLLADISEINPNVIMEFAYAWGVKTPVVILIADKNKFQSKKYSNINDTVCYKYDSGETDWLKKSILMLKVVIGLVLTGNKIS